LSSPDAEVPATPAQAEPHVRFCNAMLATLQGSLHILVEREEPYLSSVLNFRSTLSKSEAMKHVPRNATVVRAASERCCCLAACVA
jgi:hypothetical protein